MPYFQVTGNNGTKAIICVSKVSKVVDFGSYRAIYLGSDKHNFQCTDTMASIMKALQG